MVASIDIFELHGVCHEPHITEVDGEFCAVVMHFSHNSSLDGNIGRLVRGIGQHLDFLVEGAQQFGVEGEAYLATRACGNWSLWEHHIEAAARGLGLLDDERLVALVGEAEAEVSGHLELHFAHLFDVCVGHKAGLGPNH